MLNFWLRCLRWAFWRWHKSEGALTQAISGLSWLFALLGLSGIAFALLGRNLVMSFAIGIPLVLTIFVAPYKLWKAENDELTRFKEKRLVVTVETPVDASQGAIWRHLRVSNPSGLSIKDCYGQLLSFCPEGQYIDAKFKLPPPGLLYAWSSYGGQGKKANIAGRSFGKLDIAVANWPSYTDTLFTPVLAKDGYNRDMLYPLPKGTYKAEIQVGSERDIFEPTQVNLRLSFRGGRELQVDMMKDGQANGRCRDD